MSSPYELSDDLPVYVISVAAQLSGMHPQTLRAYDRLGLVSPGRSRGKGVRRKDGTNGNLLVTVEVMVPQNLNGKARSAIEDLREATAGQDPREELLERAKEA